MAEIIAVAIVLFFCFAVAAYPYWSYRQHIERCTKPKDEWKYKRGIFGDIAADKGGEERAE